LFSFFSSLWRILAAEIKRKTILTQNKPARLCSTGYRRVGAKMEREKYNVLTYEFVHKTLAG